MLPIVDHGMKTMQIDAEGRVTEYRQDTQQRLTKTIYSDTSTGVITYGTGVDEGLVIARRTATAMHHHRLRPKWPTRDHHHSRQ